MPKYFQNEEITYIKSKHVQENSFIGKEAKYIILPKFEDIRERLPKPFWEGHESTIECYYRAWEIAFSNIHNPNEESGFVSPFLDAAFNNCIFMWDSSFMLMFGKYAHNIFNFQETLDNFYAHQHYDGFISREISEKDGSEKFTRFDPASTGPNIMPWCEWEYYCVTGDKGRVEKVFPVLLAYHNWLKKYRTWRDGSYWSCGLGCGMDNQPRLKDNDNYEGRHLNPNHMVWVDICMQQILSGNILIEMARICNRTEEVSDIKTECKYLKTLVNDILWDKETGFYYDLWDDGSLNMVKSAGAYWALLAEAVPEQQVNIFVEHLENEKEFKRPNRVPTLSADHECYCETGEYWCGSVWAPTNYMILQGLRKYGYEKLAYDIAQAAHRNVIGVYEKTGTIWENYAPEAEARGIPSKPDFVGWSGLFPISILVEYIFGIEMRIDKREVVWHIHLTDEFGIQNIPFGLYGTIDLFCKKRKDDSEKPCVEIRSDADLTIMVCYGDGCQEKIEVTGKVKSK